MKKKMSSSLGLESKRVGREERMVWNQRNKKRERSRMVCLEGWPRVLFIASKTGDPRSCDQNTSQLRGLGEKCAQSGRPRSCETQPSQLRGLRGCHFQLIDLVILPPCAFFTPLVLQLLLLAAGILMVDMAPAQNFIIFVSIIIYLLDGA